MGLDNLKPFDPQKNIIEYMIKETGSTPLLDKNLKEFADETAGDSPAPGGGSISAYVSALGASLGTMVANLSAHKRGWDERWEEFSNWAVKGQKIQKELLFLVDEDTRAFNDIITAVRMPKDSAEEKELRTQAMNDATKYAVQVPFNVMETSFEMFELLEAMVKTGNPNSVTDATVGALCANTAIKGAFLNVKVNLVGFEEKAFAENILSKSKIMLDKSHAYEQKIIQITEQIIDKMN